MASEYEHIISILNLSKDTTVKIGDVKLSTQVYGDRLSVRYHSSTLLRTDCDEQIVTEVLDVQEKLQNMSTIKQNINGWEYKDDNSVFKWMTPKGNSVIVEVDSDDRLSLLTPFSYKNTQFKSLYNTKQIKFFCMLFLDRYSPREADFICARNQVAYESYVSITGFGDETAKSIITEEIFNYPDLLDQLHRISSQYRETAREEISDRIDRGEKVLDDEELLDTYSDLLTIHKI